jgi:dihydroxyacid dehydratase/phosphogluconate dehydratase
MTREAFENAIAIVAATGGSTNAALHLPAIAHECGIDVSPRRHRPHQPPHADHRGPQAVR